MTNSINYLFYNSEKYERTVQGDLVLGSEQYGSKSPKTNWMPLIGPKGFFLSESEGPNF